jgi:type IV secretory pathway VirB10-like protein
LIVAAHRRALKSFTQLAVASAVLAVITAAGSASAAEYCVTCSGPAAMYACAVSGEPRDAPENPRQQLFCIQELARQGGHETCSVPRSAPKPCPGTMRVVEVPPGGLPPAPTLPVDAPVDPVQPAPGEKQSGDMATKSKEPRTVEEMANQTVEASKKGLKKAGEAVTGTAEKAGQGVEKAGSAVGNAAKKTWNCLKSFFGDC